MSKYDVRDIFTPTKPATLTFVERQNINERLVDALHTPGKQVVVYGHSGSGKTTLLANKLTQIFENEIKTSCMIGITFDQLLLDAFDQLGLYYDAETVHTKKYGLSSSLQAEYLGIKSKIDASISQEEQIKKQRILPPQLTPQRLAKFLGEAKCCWVLEDFHKIEEKKKGNLSQVMKVFMDMAFEYNDLKIIAIGAVGTAREIVENDPEMRNRIAEIHVPLMSDDELKQIIKKGENLLNVNFDSITKNAILQYSNGLASVCHQLCLNICFGENIYNEIVDKKEFKISHFEKALLKYIENESDTIKAAFDKALRQKKKQKYNNAKLILEALTEFKIDDGANRGQIMEKLRKKEVNYPEGNLTFYLNHLQKDENGALIRFSETSGKFNFTNPFHQVFARALFEKEKLEEKRMKKLLSSTTFNIDDSGKVLSEKVTSKMVEVIVKAAIKALSV